MASNEPHPPSPEAVRQGYEPSAIRVRGLVVFFVGLVAAAVFLHALLWFLLRGLLRADRRERNDAMNRPSPIRVAPLPWHGRLARAPERSAVHAISETLFTSARARRPCRVFHAFGVLVFLCVLVAPASADAPKADILKDVGIDQKLNAQ